METCLKDDIFVTFACLEYAAEGDLLGIQRALSVGFIITGTDRDGMTCLLIACANDHLPLVQFLLANGSSVHEANRFGRTAVLLAAANGDLNLLEWLLAEGGGSILDTDKTGFSVWDLLERHVMGVEAHGASVESTSLLKVMVLLSVAPPRFLSSLMPQYKHIVAQGQQLRALFPSYIEQQGILIAANNSLPTVLHTLVLAYAVPTPDDMWTDWVRWL
jgi:ankyrin repeat protein